MVGAIDAKRILKARNLVQRALDIGRGTAHLLDAKHRVTVMSTEMSCPGCGRAFEELDPRLFSFNSPHGACEECGGFGEIWNRARQTAAEDTGESVLENELTAERESEWIDEDETRALSGLSRLAPESDRATRAGAESDDRQLHRALGGRSAAADRPNCGFAAIRRSWRTISCRRFSSGFGSWRMSGSVISRSAVRPKR